MPEDARPWPCYPTAHLGDKELARCSWGAEGLLWRLCSLSATGHIFGCVTDSKGKGLTVTEIMETKGAGVIRGRVTIEETQKLLKELLDEGRIEYDKRIKAYAIPKMLRIGRARKNSVAYGQRGGSPLLIAQRKQQEWDRAVKNTVDKLWGIEKTIGPSSGDFSTAMSLCGKEYYPLGKNKDGMDVVSEALEIIKYRRQTKQ